MIISLPLVYTYAWLPSTIHKYLYTYEMSDLKRTACTEVCAMQQGSYNYQINLKLEKINGFRFLKNIEIGVQLQIIVYTTNIEIP